MQKRMGKDRRPKRFYIYFSPFFLLHFIFIPFKLYKGITIFKNSDCIIFLLHGEQEQKKETSSDLPTLGNVQRRHKTLITTTLHGTFILP